MQDALQKFVYDQALTAATQDVRLRCPACAPNRKLIHRNEKTLSITVLSDRATFFCHHCLVKGAVTLRDNVTPLRPVPPPAPRKKLELLPLSQAAKDFLASRGLTAEDAERAGVSMVRQWFRELGREGEALAFRYVDDDGAEAFKLRSIEGKHFACNGSPKTFFNAPANTPHTLVITEGELDALTVGTVPEVHAVSVPSGALNKALPDGSQDGGENSKLSFLWAHRKLLDAVKRVLICTDADRQGQLMAEELGRRIGKSKCFLVSYPDGCKDINDVLLKVGAEGVKRSLADAKPYKIAGLHGADEFQTLVQSLYDDGLRGGALTGWPSVDKILTVQPGLLYVVTGVPGHGKSSWMDALTVHLAKTKGWPTVMASFENPPPVHIAKLAACHTGLPFGHGYSRRMTPEGMQEAVEWVRSHYLFMSCDEEAPTVQSILDRARAGILRIGAKVIVMDPANFLQFKDSGDKDHNENVDEALVQFRAFAAAHDVAMFLVAHPRKPGNDTSASWYPTGYSIAGTAGYYNRPDVGITIHRTEEDFTRVIVWKARFGHIAINGEATLSYDASTGTFSESKVRPAKAQGQNNYWDDF